MDIDLWRVEYHRLYPEVTVDGVQVAHHAVERRPPVAADQTGERIRRCDGERRLEPMRGRSESRTFRSPLMAKLLPVTLVTRCLI